MGRRRVWYVYQLIYVDIFGMHTLRRVCIVLGNLGGNGGTDMLPFGREALGMLVISYEYIAIYIFYIYIYILYYYIVNKIINYNTK